MRTNIVNGKIVAAVVKNSDQFAGDCDRLTLSVDEIFNSANRVVFGHGALSL
jgi:hypothetical protein